MTLEHFCSRYPYRAVLALFATQIFVLLIVGGVVLRAGGTSTDVAVSGVIWGNLVLSLILAVLLTRLHWWREVGFAWPQRPGALLYALFPLIVLFDNSFEELGLADGSFLRLGIAMALVGFVEETLYRGVMLRILLPSGTWKAAIVSSAIFGLAHGMGVLVGQDLARIFFQIGYASAIGFAYAAIVIRTGALWPVILLHFAINLIALLTGEEAIASERMTQYEQLIQAVYIVVFIVFGSVLIRTRQQPGDGNGPAR
jgi:membrane protease YdiL (CAAX protease family)